MMSNDTRRFIRTVGNKYVLAKYISSGTFGSVYLAYQSNAKKQLYAVKVENANSKNSLLVRESRILKYLGSEYFGIPQVFHTGRESNFNVMVMSCLGPNYESLLAQRGRFSLKTTLMLAFQMINRLQYIHSRGYLHGDIKPSNFCAGIHDRSHLVHCIDFGLSKPFRTDLLSKNHPNNRSNSHIRFHRNRKSITGTARFCSIRNHLGFEVSRRDDMESLGFVFIYFLCGDLPWKDINFDESVPHASPHSSPNGTVSYTRRLEKLKAIRMKKILESKIQFAEFSKKRILLNKHKNRHHHHHQDICNGNNGICENNNDEFTNMGLIPDAFLEYLDHVRNLEFEEVPDYDFYRSLFSNLFKKCSYEYDHRYDWVIPKMDDEEEE